MADRYVVAAGGNWNTTTTWSATSGGAGGASIPIASDNVFVNASSGNLVIDSNSGCANFDASGHVGTISGSTAITITGGTITLSAAGAFTYTGNASADGSNAGGDVIITSAGRVFGGSFTLGGTSKTFKLADAFGAASLTLTLSGGTFNSQSNNITLSGNLLSNNTNTRVVTLSGSDVVANAVIINATNLTWAPPDSLTINNGSTPSSGGNFFTVVGSLSFDVFNINVAPSATARYGGQINSTGGTISIGELNFIGAPNSTYVSCVINLSADMVIDKANFVEGTQLVSSVNGTQRTITTNTNEISFDGCMIRDIVISGGPAIATNSIDLGNNSGIDFGPFGPATNSIVGVTKDDAGVALPSCTVVAFKEHAGTYFEVSRTTSHAVTGAYTLPTPDTDPEYLIVATKETPNRADAMNNIVPA
jgi:hypothetical protein